MVKCDICGKEFKNTQGLRGHKFFRHGIKDSKQQLTARPAAEQPLSELESRLEQGEELARVNTERLTEQLEQYTHRLTELGEQLNDLTRQVSLGPTNNSYDRLTRRIAQLTEQVSRNSRWLTPDDMGLFVAQVSNKPPAFLVDLKNLIKQVNENQGVINWVRKKFNLVKRKDNKKTPARSVLSPGVLQIPAQRSRGD